MNYIYIHSLGQFTISGDNSLVVFDEHSSQQTRYLLIDNPCCLLLQNMHNINS